MVYVFDVKAKVRDVDDAQKAGRKLQISEVTSLGNEKVHHRSCLPKGAALPLQISARAPWARSRPNFR